MLVIVWDTDLLIKISNDPLPKVNLKLLSRDNDFVIILPVIREISGLARSTNHTTSRRAQMVLRTIEESELFRHAVMTNDVAHPTVETDEALIEFVKMKPKERILATMDGKLLSRMENLGLPYMTLSKGKLHIPHFPGATYLTKRKE